MLLRGSLEVGQPPATLAEPGMYFVHNERTGGMYSKYGVFGAVCFLPPMALEYATTGELPALDSRDRVVLLNGWNTLLTMALAGMLVRLGSLYTRRVWLLSGFAVLTVFGSFIWNYARAQATELPQILLTVVMADQLFRWMRAEGEAGRSRGVWRGLVVWACVAALALTRTNYVMLVPVVAVGMAMGGGVRRGLGWGVCGGVVVAGLMGLANFVKFGSPFLTGYHQYNPAGHMPGIDPFPAVWGFFVSAQKGIWWHFPLAGIAVVGWAGFFRRHGREAWVLVAGVVCVLVPLLFVPTWAGDWGYGPRYLVAGLPLYGLPWLSWVGNSLPGWRRNAVVGVAVATGMAGMYLGFEVNRAAYFSAYKVRAPFSDLVQPPAGFGSFAPGATYPGMEYFERRPWGVIVGDVFRAGGRLERSPLAEVAKETFSPEDYQAVRLLYWQVYRDGNWWWETGGKRFDESKFALPGDW